MVRTKRLELLQLAPLEPKSSVSTNFTTSAQRRKNKGARLYNQGAFEEYGVDDGNRTHDNWNHNPALYQLSYAHHIAVLLCCGTAYRSMVRTKRLELLQLAPLEPKSSVSTNFTTSA